MSQLVFYRYLWFFDTVWRYKRITRAEINRLWKQSELSGGEPMSRRTFLNYREGAEALFDVNIMCDPATYEYYIEPTHTDVESGLRRWLYDSLSVNHLLRDSNRIADRILPEQFPSGIDYLELIIGAMRDGKVVRFMYHAFWKQHPKAVLLEPYFVKAFRKRWYVVGFNREERVVKTYALDRVKKADLLTDDFVYPADFDAVRYFEHCFGVMRGDEIVEDVRLRVTLRQAQYFRALPLHSSQREYATGNGFVDFGYRLCITYDLVQELLSLGREVTVLAPVRLRNEMIARLQAALATYENGGLS